MKKIPFSAHPHFILIPSIYFLLVISYSFFANPEYRQVYLLAAAISLPVIIYQKTIMSRNFSDYVQLYENMATKQQAKINKAAYTPLTLWIMLAIAHFIFNLPIIWVALAFSVLVFPEQKKIYEGLADKVENREEAIQNLKKQWKLVYIILSVIFIMFVAKGYMANF